MWALWKVILAAQPGPLGPPGWDSWIGKEALVVLGRSKL